MLRFQTTVACAGAAFVIMLFGAPAATAETPEDEIRAAITSGLEAYDAGNLAESKRQLDYAAQLIAQANAGRLAALLPEPLEGWQAEEAEGTAAAAGFGAGLRAARAYSKEGSDVSVTIVGDSPMVAQTAMLLQNPAMAAATGMTLKTIAGQQALIGDEGDVNIMVGTRWMISVDGSAAPADKEAYAAAIDFDALNGL